MPLILNVSPKAMHFVRTYSIMRARDVRLICSRKSLKLWKNCIHQKHVRKWLVEGMHPPPGYALVNFIGSFIMWSQPR